MSATVDCQPSRFLDEIPPRLVESHEPQEAVDDKKAVEMFENMKKQLQMMNKGK